MKRLGLRAAVLAAILAAAAAAAFVLDGSGSKSAARIAPKASGAPAVAHAVGSAASAPIVIRPDAFSISPPMSTVDPGPTGRSGIQGLQREAERPLIPLGPRTTTRDPVVQRSAPNVMPGPLNSFPGIMNANNNNVDCPGCLTVPPDVEGDVGPSDYVEYVNISWSVYDKLTGAARAGFPKSNAALWAGMGDVTCEDWYEGDPVVMYDQAANRWFLAEFAFRISGGNIVAPIKICVAVSTTGNPTGSYARYSYTFTRGATPIFPDYPKFGVWPDAYYMSANLFNQAADTYLGAAAGAFDRAAMIAGTPTAALLLFDLPDTNLGGMLPSDWEGDIAPPAGSPNVFLEADDAAVCCTTQDRLQVWKFHSDFAVPGNSTFTHTDDITVPEGLAPIDMDICNAMTFEFACIPNPDASHNLDSLSDRLMHRLQYRKYPSGVQSLVVNHTVDENGQGHAGIRWYELRLDGSFNPSIFQQGTFAPDANHRWMGSAAMDGLGNLAIGYSVSNGLPNPVFPSIRYAGRLSSDPAGQLSQGEAELQAGTGTQTIGGTFGPGAEVRWGDYTALQVDPTDECTFWYVNEYYPVSSDFNWNTRFGSFKFPTCNTPTAVSVRSFSSRWTKAGVAVSWRTGAERQTAGFNVWRTGRDGVARRVNAKLIRAKAAGSARGASYRFVDRLVKRGAFATYRLQAVGLDGKRAWYGVGSAPTRS